MSPSVAGLPLPLWFPLGGGVWGWHLPQSSRPHWWTGGLPVTLSAWTDGGVSASGTPMVAPPTLPACLC